MQIIKEKIQSNLDICSLLKLDKTELVIFDIETTGLSAKNSNIYLIGYILFSENGFELRQLFAESYEDEPLLLEKFFKDIKDKLYIISYNGNGFDIPYIDNKAEFYNIPNRLSSYESIDLYRMVKKYKHHFNLLSYKQPNIEDFLNIPRKDTLNGGILINYYKEYVKTKSTNLYEPLILHNHDDLIGLFDIIEIIKYINVFKGDFENVTVTDFSSHIIITAHLKYTLPTPLSSNGDYYYLTLSDNILKCKISVNETTLKHFFDNYKDYYYLPAEDNAIHKSLGEYVDKTYRQKATKQNCYIKRQSRFIKNPGLTDIATYGMDYSSRNEYVELNEELNEELNITEYLKKIL